jgi:flagellar basal body-associated protein FliL
MIMHGLAKPKSMFSSPGRLYMQVYGIIIIIIIIIIIVVVVVVAIVVVVKKYNKTECTTFLRMNTWMFETCRRHYN